MPESIGAQTRPPGYDLFVDDGFTDANGRDPGDACPSQQERIGGSAAPFCPPQSPDYGAK